VSDIKLEMTPEIERQAIRIVVKDSGFISKWRDRLQPEHFDIPHNQVIFKATRDYTKQYGKLPTIETVYQLVKRILSIDDNVEAFMQYITKLFNELDHQDSNFVKTLLLEHMELVDTRIFISEAVKCFGSRDLKKIPQLAKALEKTYTIDNPTGAYHSTPDDKVVARVALESTAKAALPTPWPSFNRQHGGGFHAGSLSCFMGSTGSGKSIMLANVSSHLMRAGYTVYFFTFELSRLKTSARHDVILTGCTYEERKTNPEVIDQAIDRLKANGMGDLYVIQYPTGTASANTVRTVIDEYRVRGCKPPDIVVLDYISIMSPNDPDGVDMKRDYAKLKVVAEEVRALAMELDIPFISALQSNRGAADKEKQTKQDIADSYAVMHVLDCVLSINQSDLEKQAGKIRLYAAKVRDYNDSYTVVTRCDYNNLRVTEDEKTTANYNRAIEDLREKVMSQSAVVGAPPPSLSAVIDPGASNAGLESLLAMSLNPVKRMLSEPTDAELKGVNRLVPPPVVDAKKLPLPPPFKKE
jgi:KaiC/GvpD/RAD55 family RecA-like ATPase